MPTFDPDATVRDHAVLVYRDPASSPEDREAARKALAGEQSDDSDSVTSRMTPSERHLLSAIWSRRRRARDGEGGSPNRDAQEIAAWASVVALEEAPERAGQVPVCATCHRVMVLRGQLPVPGYRYDEDGHVIEPTR